MKVLCVGLMVCDIMAKPISVDMLNKDHSKIDFIDIRVGGDAFNVAANLVALGVENSLYSAVGSDCLGVFALNFATDKGVNAANIAITKQPTSASLIMIKENAERHFISQQGASQFITGTEINDELLEEHDVLYIGSAGDLPSLNKHNMKALLLRAKAHNMITAMDITGNPSVEAMEYLSPSLDLLDFFLPSDYEAMQITNTKTSKEAASAFIAAGVGNVIIKQGQRGCMYVSAKSPNIFKQYPAFKTTPVDTTGAGDAFVSGFLASYCNDYPIEKCIKIASLTGAECVKKIGAVVNLKHTEHYNKMLKKAEDI